MEMEIRLRKAFPGDAPEIAEIIEEDWKMVLSNVYSKEVVELFLSFNSEEKIRKAIEKPERICTVAVVNGKIVGFSEAKIEGGGVIIGRLMVKKDLHRRGIRSALLAELKKLSLPIEVEATIYWRTLEFYKKHGFVEVERKNKKINNIEVPVVLMELKHIL